MARMFAHCTQKASSWGLHTPKLHLDGSDTVRNRCGMPEWWPREPVRCPIAGTARPSGEAFAPSTTTSSSATPKARLAAAKRARVRARVVPGGSSPRGGGATPQRESTARAYYTPQIFPLKFPSNSPLSLHHPGERDGMRSDALRNAASFFNPPKRPASPHCPVMPPSHSHEFNVMRSDATQQTASIPNSSPSSRPTFSPPRNARHPFFPAPTRRAVTHCAMLRQFFQLPTNPCTPFAHIPSSNPVASFHSPQKP